MLCADARAMIPGDASGPDQAEHTTVRDDLRPWRYSCAAPQRACCGAARALPGMRPRGRQRRREVAPSRHRVRRGWFGGG